jgi:hypothetical protein
VTATGPADPARAAGPTPAPRTTPGGEGATATAEEQRLLVALLEAAHAAVYGYGVLGARLDAAARRAALQAHDAVRVRRDSLAARLRERGQDPPAPLPAYAVEVDSPEAALRLAVRLEEGLAVRWRDLVGGSDDAQLRTLAVSALQESAVRAAQWRRRAGVEPPTVALPGVA